MIVGHGDDSYRYADAIRYDFSSNVPYLNHSDAVLAHLASRLSLLCHYPDPTAGTVRELLSKQWGLPADYFWVTNGSTEAFYLTAHLFAESDTLITVPSFAEYEDACRLYRHRPSFCSISELADRRIASRTVWTGLPNNPDGDISHQGLIPCLCRQYPDTYFIVDEAYSELCSVDVSLLGLVRELPNLILVRSLTKSFALPGIRVGYVVAHPEVIEQLSSKAHPWSVNALALEAADFILRHYDDLLPERDRLMAESRQLQDALKELPGLLVTPSSTNYCLVELQHGTAAELKDRLASLHSILIRNADNFRSLSPRHIRIATQGAEANRHLIESLRTCLSAS